MSLEFCKLEEILSRITVCVLFILFGWFLSSVTFNISLLMLLIGAVSFVISLQWLVLLLSKSVKCNSGNFCLFVGPGISSAVTGFGFLLSG